MKLQEKKCKNCQNPFVPVDCSQTVCINCKKTLYSEGIFDIDEGYCEDDGFIPLTDYL